MGYDWLVTLALALHFGYIAYLVLGGFVAWRWPKAIWAHLAACVWGVLIVASLVNCPLTWVEDWARARAGQTPNNQGFVDRYLDNVIYPEQYVDVARLLVAGVVALSWLGAYWRWRRRRPGSIEDRSIEDRSIEDRSIGDLGADTAAKSEGDGERAVTV